MSKSLWIVFAFLLLAHAYARPAGETGEVGEVDEAIVDANDVVSDAPAVVVDEKPAVPAVVEQKGKAGTVDGKPPVVTILESETEHKDDGSYSFFYRSEDGTFRRESAVVVNAGEKDQHLQISGQYSYLDADGKEVVVNYMADNKGFVPEGNVITPEIVNSVRQTSELGPWEPEAKVAEENNRQDRQLDVKSADGEEVVANAPDVPSVVVDEAVPVDTPAESESK